MIQYDSLRAKVDLLFINAHDSLTKTYREYWKKGIINRKFKGYKPAIQEEAKPLFDKLHGLIWKLHILALELQNEQDGNPHPEIISQLSHNINGKSRKKAILDYIDKLKTNGLELNI